MLCWFFVVFVLSLSSCSPIRSSLCWVMDVEFAVGCWSCCGCRSFVGWFTRWSSVCWTVFCWFIAVSVVSWLSLSLVNSSLRWAMDVEFDVFWWSCCCRLCSFLGWSFQWLSVGWTVFGWYFAVGAVSRLSFSSVKSHCVELCLLNLLYAVDLVVVIMFARWLVCSLVGHQLDELCFVGSLLYLLWVRCRLRR